MDPFSGFGSGRGAESGSSLSDPGPNFSDLDPGFVQPYTAILRTILLFSAAKPPHHHVTLLKILTGAQSSRIV
jgi:hypothetical protein